MRARYVVFHIVLWAAPWVLADSITVRSGDSLWALAQRHDTTVDELMAVNDLDDPAITPGDTLRLPGTDASPTRHWTVEPGDSLYEIAQATDTTVEDLRAWNDLADVTIRPGQELLVRAPTSAAEPLRVQVGPGDNLWQIAQAHDVSLDELAAANDMAPSDVLHPGDVLLVPGVHVRASSSPEQSGGQGGYAAPVITVDPGDTLWEIARRYDTTVAALMDANELSDPTLRAGQSLRVVNEQRAGTGEAAASHAVSEAAERADPSSELRWPLQGAITSHFGWRALRVGGTNMHYGVDIDGHRGDTIVSATNGVVTYSGWMGGFGQLVIIEHEGVEYYYAHASVRLVNEGRTVSAGDPIARVGATGRVTGTHLHFEVRVDGSPIDPMPHLEAGTTASPQAAAR